MSKRHLAISCAVVPLWIASALASPQTRPDNLAQKMGLKAGRWHTTIRIVSAQVLPATPADKVPPEVEAELRDRSRAPYQTDDCIGSRFASKSDLILPGIKIEADCVRTQPEVLKQSLRLKTTCGSLAKGFKVDTDVRATYQNSAMAARISVAAWSKNTRTITKLELTTSSRYVGAC
jgi:hypothetical protein